MKKKFIIVSSLTLFLGVSFTADAQMMNNGTDMTSDDVAEHTKQEEAEGKEVWEKLQSRQLTCDALTDEDYGVLGEYFMGQMTGPAHAAMNEMMIRTHGEEGEEQIHATMGKRLSGCDTTAAFSPDWVGGGWMPMMWGGMHGWNGGSMGYRNYAWTSLVTTLLIWAALALIIAALWKRLKN